MTMRPFFAIVAVLAISGLEFAASVEPNNDGNHVLIAKYTAQALVTDLVSDGSSFLTSIVTRKLTVSSPRSSFPSIWISRPWKNN
jgi:hypothetical protein